MSAHKKLSVSLNVLLSNHSDISKNELGTIMDFKAKLLLKPGMIPKFCKAWSVPYAIRGAIEGDLDRLEVTGIVERVTRSNWDAPIVAVLKKDGVFRICGDYKVTDGKWSSGLYPLPNLSEFFATLAGGKTFTKLDLSQDYQQHLLDPGVTQSMLQ